MLALSVALLGLTVALGATLALLALRRPGSPPRALVALHGIAALFGYAALIWALRGPARGIATGTQSFGKAAAILLLLAAFLGAMSFVLHRRRRRLPGLWVGAHATVAIAGYVLIVVYLLAG